MTDSEELTENQILSIFKQMRAEQQAISSKITELEIELNEHK